MTLSNQLRGEINEIVEEFEKEKGQEKRNEEGEEN